MCSRVVFNQPIYQTTDNFIFHSKFQNKNRPGGRRKLVNVHESIATTAVSENQPNITARNPYFNL